MVHLFNDSLLEIVDPGNSNNRICYLSIYRQTSKLQVRIDRQKSSKYFASLIDLHDIPAPEEKLQN